MAASMYKTFANNENAFHLVFLSTQNFISTVNC